MRGKHNKLGEGERKVRLGQDSLPNIAISIAEMSGNYIRCFTQTISIGKKVLTTKIRQAARWTDVSREKASVFC